MAHREASQGGCWFCNTDDNQEGWIFSMEWDAFYHPSCLRRAYLAGNEEAEIIVRNEYSEADKKMLLTEDWERIGHNA